MLHALGLFGAVVISFSAILVRLADVSPTTAAFFRPLYALPFIVLLCWATRHGCPRSARQRWICVGAGVLMGVSATLGNYSIGYVGAGLATVLANTQVVFVALVAWLVLRERPSLNAFFAAPLVFAGVALVTGIGRPDAYGEEPVSGVLFGLGNAIVYATFLLLFRPALRGLTIPTGPLLDATLGATAATFLLGVATIPPQSSRASVTPKGLYRSRWPRVDLHDIRSHRWMVEQRSSPRRGSNEVEDRQTGVLITRIDTRVSAGAQRDPIA